MSDDEIALIRGLESMTRDPFQRPNQKVPSQRRLGLKYRSFDEGDCNFDYNDTELAILIMIFWVSQRQLCPEVKTHQK